jgi:serine/threonine protein phosphatase PrpC
MDNANNDRPAVIEKGDGEITAKLATAELWEGWAQKLDRQPQHIARIRFGAKTDMGRVRENNEDKFDFFIPDQPAVLAAKGMLFAVADGMGGHAAGQIASELALKLTIKAYYGDSDDDVPASIRAAASAANSLIHDTGSAIPDRTGMGTTLTAAIIREQTMYVAQVGDSRCYLLRDGCLDQVTVDHSWVEEQVRRGAMTREEAEGSPFHNLITRSLGSQPQVEVDTYEVALNEGDRILLCSDGLSGMIAHDQIESLLGESSGPSMAAMVLTDRAFSNGGIDNITAVVLYVDGFEEYGAGSERRSALSRLFKRDG